MLGRVALGQLTASSGVSVISRCGNAVASAATRLIAPPQWYKKNTELPLGCSPKPFMIASMKAGVSSAEKPDFVYEPTARGSSTSPERCSAT